MKFLKYISVLPIAFSLTGIVQAKGQETQVPCPSALLVSQSVQSLDLVWRDEANGPNSYYFEVKSRWHDIETKNASWDVRTYVTAPDFNTALNMAQKNVKDVAQPLNKYATYDEFEFSCSYLDYAGHPIAMVTTNKFNMDKMQRAALKS